MPCSGPLPCLGDQLEEVGREYARSARAVGQEFGDEAAVGLARGAAQLRVAHQARRQIDVLQFIFGMEIKRIPSHCVNLLSDTLLVRAARLAGEQWRQEPVQA